MREKERERLKSTRKKKRNTDSLKLVRANTNIVKGREASLWSNFLRGKNAVKKLCSWINHCS